ncbi:MAG: efflux RND transporter periplasmic adaptor subunit [Chitinispirillaceae bacterium]
MKNIMRIKWVGLVGVAALAVFTAGCAQKEKDKEQQVRKIVLPVRAAVAVKRNVVQSLRFSGSIDAFKRVAVAPAKPGSRITRIYVEEGQRVRRGKLLVSMENFQLKQSEANYKQLETQFERIKTLHERGSATTQQFDQVKSSYDAAKAGYELLRKSVYLRAPYSGTVIGRYHNEGEVYSGTPGSEGISAIVELAQLDRMKIEIMVPEREFVHLEPGQRTEVRVDAFPDTVFSGTVNTVNPSLNRMSRTSRVTIEIKNRDRLLKPGMFARVEVITDVKKDVLAVPATALVKRDGGMAVFTVDRKTAPFETKPKMVKVGTGRVTEEYAQILSGIREGTVVLTDNNVSLQEKTSIKVTGIEQADSKE